MSSKKIDYFRVSLVIVAWVIFVGLGIETGAFLTHFIATLLLSPEGAKNFWIQADLSALYHFNQAHYVTLTTIVVIVGILKTLMFYFIVTILYDKKINPVKPFNETLQRFLSITAYLSLGIGLFSFWGAKFAGQMKSFGAEVPDIQQLRLGGADVSLFMGVTLLIISFIFRKGVEIQNENDLTV